MVKMSGKVFAYEVVVYIYYTILHNHISSADEVWKKKFKLPKLKTFKRTIAKTTLWMSITDFIILRKYSFEFLSKFWKPFIFLFLMNRPTDNVMFILQKLSRHEEILKNFIRNGWGIYILNKQLRMIFFSKPVFD